MQGYGAYAFASASGVDILFNDKEFDALLERGTYSMIVGIDEITNVKCLDLLGDIKNRKPNFSVKAFYHNNNGSIFHPKISFFRKDDEKGSLVVGSGNLTIGGLRKNREMFGLIELSKEEFSRVEIYWNAWLEESSLNIREIEDPEVVFKAEKNIYKKIAIKEIDRSIAHKLDFEEGDIQEIEEEENTSQEVSALITEGWHYTEDCHVLLAEIPRSGDRWKQANFDVMTFQNFFGATPGDNSQRILLRNLNDDALLSAIEIRPSVSVRSQNYRFELDAASGLMYPITGKPIGIFIRLTTRMFLYKLFMPNDQLYTEITEWMHSKWKGRSDRMKRIETTASEVDFLLSETVFQYYKV